MDSESLNERLENAVRHAEFTDVFRNRFDSSAVLHLYNTKRRCPLSSTEAISVRDSELRTLTTELESTLGINRSSESGLVGNGLYKLTGSLASPRLPSTEDYAKILVLAAARLGAKRVCELVASWIEGNGIRVLSCFLLKGLQTDGELQPLSGILLETLSGNGNELPRSLRLEPHEHWHEQFVRRALLAFEYETISGLYDPGKVHDGFPLQALPRQLVNSDLSSVSIESFCRAISLKMNNHIDWFIGWMDYGDVDAFFLNPGFSSRRKEASNTALVTVTEEDIHSSLHTHGLLNGFGALNLPIARWRRSKQSVDEYEQLIDLRIALESVLLSDNRGRGGKRNSVAIRGAWLLGESVDDRKRNFDTLRCVYDYASSVIHGGTPKVKKGRDLGQDIAEAQDICRNAIIKIAEAGEMPDWSKLVLGQEQEGP